MNGEICFDELVGDRERVALALAAALSEVARSVSATLDLAAIFERIFDMLGRFVPYWPAILLLRDGALTVAAARGFPPEPLLRNVVLSLYPGATNYPIIAEGRTLWLADARSHPGWQAVPGHRARAPWIGTPLSVDEHVIGMLTIDKWEPGLYNERHTTVAQAFASHVRDRDPQRAAL